MVMEMFEVFVLLLFFFPSIEISSESPKFNFKFSGIVVCLIEALLKCLK